MPCGPRGRSPLRPRRARSPRQLHRSGLAIDQIDKAVRALAKNRRKTPRIKPFACIVAKPGVPEHIEAFSTGVLTDLWALTLVDILEKRHPRNTARSLNTGSPYSLRITLVQTPRWLAVRSHRLRSRNCRRKTCNQREQPPRSRALAAQARAAENRQLRWNGARFCLLKRRMNRCVQT